jgi:hypothetical protein
LVRVGIVPRPGATTVWPSRWDGYEIPMIPVDLSSSFIRNTNISRDVLAEFIPAQVIPLYLDARG